MRVTASFYVPPKHDADMRQAIADGDHSWILETLHFAELLEAKER